MEKRRIGVRAIVYKDGKILAVRHKGKDGTSNDWWAIPGGGLDPGESLEEGLKREIKEELGVSIVPGRLLFIQQFTSNRTDCDEELEFFFLIENSDYFASVDFSKTSHGLAEITACEFIKPATVRILPGFISKVDIQSYVDTNQPVLVANRFVE